MTEPVDDRMIIFVVTMYRWGSKENHSYVLGVFDLEMHAQSAELNERKYRGGKYVGEILRCVVQRHTGAEGDLGNHEVQFYSPNPWVLRGQSIVESREPMKLSTPSPRELDDKEEEDE